MTNKKQQARITDTFLAYRGVLKHMLNKVVASAEVEDIVQETFIRAHEAEMTKHIEYPKAFMYKTARNLALSFINKKEHSCTSKLEDTAEWEVYINEYYQLDDHEAKEKFRLFCAAVRELPLQCRKAFIMKRVFGYSIKEISLTLEISDSTTEKHIAKGVLRCANFLSNNGYVVNERVKHPLQKSNKTKTSQQ